MGIEGQVKRIAFWDMVMCALFDKIVVNILANVVDHLLYTAHGYNAKIVRIELLYAISNIAI